MKPFAAAALLLLFASCDELHEIDTTPPAAPRGIRTVSLDNAIEISWLDNTEPDVAGYQVWWSDQYDGRYTLLGKTTDNIFTDNAARNGVTTYYAISAYDFEGNESDLSKDVVYDTPRPEGLGAIVTEYRALPLRAGYDFSTYSSGPYDDPFTDFFFEVAGSRNILNVWTDTDIQDMGYTTSLDEISSAPTMGWSPSKMVEAIPGHTYVIWTWDDHYAKVRVREISTTRLVFDWAYQTAAGNIELRISKPVPARRAPLERLTGQ
jgi:hypothetical protein